MSNIPSGPRIAIIGSCQVVGLKAALQKLRPDADITSWPVGPATIREEVAAQLGQFDLIVSQILEADRNAPLDFRRLQETYKTVFYVPTLVFNGFHPDCIYLKMGEKLCEGPLHHLQSAIIATAYCMGLPEQRVPRLFNALTYSSLGYFEAFGIARDFTLRSFSAAGFDLAPYLDEWRRTTGSFMHTLNHPRIHVLARLAHMIAVRGELIDEATALPDDVEDWLGASVRWPVYPEIARRLAMPDRSLVFKWGSRNSDVQTIVAGCYKNYDGYERAEMRAALPPRFLEGLEAVLAT